MKDVWRDESDDRLYPEYRLNDYLIQSLQDEAFATFKLMVRENLPITTLVDADFVLVNDVLSKHYGMEPQSGSHLRKVELAPDSPYGGLLTTGAIMKITANGTATSPILRGAWVMEHLLGTPPPPPPADIRLRSLIFEEQLPLRNSWQDMQPIRSVLNATPCSTRSASL